MNQTNWASAEETKNLSESKSKNDGLKCFLTQEMLVVSLHRQEGIFACTAAA